MLFIFFKKKWEIEKNGMYNRDKNAFLQKTELLKEIWRLW